MFIYVYLFTDFLWTFYLYTNRICIFILELIKTRSIVQDKNMSCERALSFDQ